MEENTTSSSPAKETSNSMKYVVIAIIALLIISGGYYLSKKAMKSGQPASSMTQMANESPTGTDAKGMKTSTTITQAASSPSAMTQTEQDITVTGSNFKFEPATMTVKKGQTVKITFNNSGGFHDWNLDEFNAHTKKIPANQSDTVTFTADKTGTFEYYCSVGNHRAMGMKGTLTVE